MPILYGIQSVIKPSVAETPVSISTELVFIGAVKSNKKQYEPVSCGSMDDLLSVYNLGTDYDNLGEFYCVANYAFNYLNLDHAWFINIGSADYTKDPLTITEAAAKAGVDAVHDIYNEHGVVPNLVVLVNNDLHIASPISGTSAPANIAAYACAKCLNVSDHFKAQVVYDQTLTETNLEAITRNGVATGYYKLALLDEITKDSEAGNAIACIGSAVGINTHVTPIGISGGTPVSVIVACNRAQQDALNTGNVPYRSVGNLECQTGDGFAGRYVKDTSGVKSVVVKPLRNNKDIDDAASENGFVILRNKGQNHYVTWGDHTAKYYMGYNEDELYRFDSSVAIAYHLANRWILKWQSYIDAPMTLSLRNDIINEEQSYLDYLVSIGALVGNPKCEFKNADNTMDTLQMGQFYFTNTYTSAIPAKYLQLNLVWTSEGLKSYIED